MDLIEIETLHACHELLLCRQELFPLFESALGVMQKDVFYTWAFRKCQQRGRLSPQTAWTYFFHGLECDLKNTLDGRLLRIDFGPHGRIDTFTAWGVLQFIMTSVAPWPDYHKLKHFFADTGPPFDQFSGNFDTFCVVWNQLEEKGCFEIADAELVQLQNRYTIVDVHGTQHIRFPKSIPASTQIDCSVAHRKILSQYGYHLVATCHL